MAAKGDRLRTFSMRFEDAEYDETEQQRAVVAHLHSEHAEIVVSRRDIADVFPQVVVHTERPILRTAPAPLYLLSKLVRESGIKVVLTGEGADEMFAGYDLFREAKVRRFWARQPSTGLRPRLLERLYPYLQRSPVSQLVAVHGMEHASPSHVSVSQIVTRGATHSPTSSHEPPWNKRPVAQRSAPHDEPAVTGDQSVASRAECSRRAVLFLCAAAVWVSVVIPALLVMAWRGQPIIPWGPQWAPTSSPLPVRPVPVRRARRRCCCLCHAVGRPRRQ